MERPTKPYEVVKTMLGNVGCAWEKLVGHIRFYYVMDEIWDEGKPTNKHHNNLYFRRSGKTLVTLCIRDGYFVAYTVFGKVEREKFDEQREAFDNVICKEYDEAHTYHDGKWLSFEVHDETLIDDIILLLHMKRKPNRKILPESLEKCGCLDLGLSHEDITNALIS